MCSRLQQTHGPRWTRQIKCWNRTMTHGKVEFSREESKGEPTCSISEIQSFCCIPKIANKSLLSFWDSQMCFISSFTSERVDLPGDEREESVAMAEGYNYIKTLPSKQWVITLPHTLRGPAPAARHPGDFTGFYLLPRAGTAPSRPFFTNRTPPHASSCTGCLSCAASPSPWLLWWWNDIP